MQSLAYTKTFEFPLRTVTNQGGSHREFDDKSGFQNWVCDNISIPVNVDEATPANMRPVAKPWNKITGA